jgi:hypothetical protein
MSNHSIPPPNGELDKTNKYSPQPLYDEVGLCTMYMNQRSPSDQQPQTTHQFIYMPGETSLPCSLAS